MPLPSTRCSDLGVNLDFSSSFRLLNPICQPFFHRPCPGPSPAPRAQLTVTASWTPLHRHSSPSAQVIFKKMYVRSCPSAAAKSFRSFLSTQNKIRALTLAYKGPQLSHAHFSEPVTPLFLLGAHKPCSSPYLRPSQELPLPLRTPGLYLFAQQASSSLCLNSASCKGLSSVHST